MGNLKAEVNPPTFVRLRRNTAWQARELFGSSGGLKLDRGQNPVPSDHGRGGQAAACRARAGSEPFPRGHGRDGHATIVKGARGVLDTKGPGGENEGVSSPDEKPPGNRGTGRKPAVNRPSTCWSWVGIEYCSAAVRVWVGCGLGRGWVWVEAGLIIGRAIILCLLAAHKKGPRRLPRPWGSDRAQAPFPERRRTTRPVTSVCVIGVFISYPLSLPRPSGRE